MSDLQATEGTTKVNLLHNFIQKRDGFIQQSNALQAQLYQLQANLHQLQGSIFAYNEIISRIENNEKESMEELAKEDNQGEKVDGEVNSEHTE